MILSHGTEEVYENKETVDPIQVLHRICELSFSDGIFGA